MHIDNFREIIWHLERLQNYLDNGVTVNAALSDTATETTLAALLDELKLKADLTEKQPTRLFINKDGTDTAVTLDTVAPYANVPIPVALTDVTGSAIVTITAGDINVGIKHDGTDPSSVRIGDGTTLTGVTTSNELKVKETTIGDKTDAKNTATDSTSVTLMQVLKQISYMAQNPASVAVTNANLDIALSALRDAITGTSPNNKTLYDLLNLLVSEPILLVGNYSSPTDGTVVYTSNATLTCSGFPFTVDSNNCNILGVYVTNSTGAVSKYVNGHNGISLSASSNVVSIIGATPFAATDTKYRLIIHCQEKGYDVTTDTKKVSIQSADWGSKNTSDSPVPLIAAAQTLTTSFTDFGFEVPTSGYRFFKLWLNIDINQGTGVQIRALEKHTSAGTDEYKMRIETVSSTKISIDNEIVEFPNADDLYTLVWDLHNTTPYIQLQMKESVDGGTDSIILSAYYTLGY